MTQEPPQDSKLDADISPANEKEKESLVESSGDGIYPRYFLPTGPHQRVRAELMWVNKLLAYDQNDSVSGISVRELREALLRFQKDLRVQVRGQLPLPVFLEADTLSQSGAPRRRIRGTKIKRGEPNVWPRS